MDKVPQSDSSRRVVSAGQSQSRPANHSAAESGNPAVDVQSLMAGLSEVRLLHEGQEYRLRITRQGKLILTK